MGVECAFRSDHPDVLAGWSEALRKADEFNEALRALTERFGGRNLYMSNAFGGKRPVGFEEHNGDRDSPPEGLRYNKRDGFLTPNLRSKAGKALRDEMHALKFDRPSLPGMPAILLGVPYVHAPSLDLIDGSVWAGWGCSEDRLVVGSDEDRTVDQVDLTIWQPVPLSEFYAARETQAVSP